MAVLRHTILQIALVALAVFASASMSYVIGGSRGGFPPSRSQQLQTRQLEPSTPAGDGGIVTALPPQVFDKCVPSTAANPIKEMYPLNATGVLNATLAILPITMEEARRIVPAKWAILERPLRAALPGFPEGMYPVLLQAAYDHDVGLHGLGFTIPDFSRAGFEFPFIDLLGDGYSSFRWAPSQFLSEDNEMAMDGSRIYGTEVLPATFEPRCDAYSASGNSNDPSLRFAASSTSPAASLVLEFSRAAASAEFTYPVSFFKNITNQPSFADGVTCDNMIRLFNTTVSASADGEPRPVVGRLTTTGSATLFSDEEELGYVREVKGIHVVTAFIENNYIDCMSMQGYQGTGGSGDSETY